MVDPLVNVLSMEDHGIAVYPNPVSEGFTIELPEKFADTDAYLINAVGQKFPLELNAGTNWIPADHLQSGVYILLVPVDDRFLQKKILIGETK